MSRTRGSILPILILLGPGPAFARPSTTPPAADAAAPVSAARAGADPRLTDDNLLLYEVRLDELSLTETIATYGSAGGPLIPLGELSRLLDADITVSPASGRVTGNIGAARRPVLIDVAAGIIRVKGDTTPLAADDVAVGLTDIYVRPGLLARILPVEVTIDDRGLRIQMKALEPLPIQSKLDRLGKLRELRPEIATKTELLQATAPYRFITPPTLDVSLATAADSRRPKFPTRYDIRAGADLLYTSFQGYVGSDANGKVSTVRGVLERRDPNGMFGSLKITRASVGDIFTPTLAMGPRSVGGRGVSFTNAPLTLTSVFQRIDLRGELPIGYDVELYVNDVLRGGQQAPVQGRYEFLNVPLTRGTNVIRLVSYGPRGERSEEVRVISVGDGQLAKGSFLIDGGAAQEGKDVFHLWRARATDGSDPGVGRLRVAANVGYGLTSRLTLTGGVAAYAPDSRTVRELATVGLRTSLRGLATQVDLAQDSIGGSGLAIALAGHPLGLATIARHAEYRGGFIDETIAGGGDGRGLTRYSELTVDLSAKAFGIAAIPMAISAQRTEFADGGTDVRGTLRASSPIRGVLLSAGLDYDRMTPHGARGNSLLAGNVAASTYAALQWQLRASIDYILLPTASLRHATVTADRTIGKATAVRFSVGHSFESDHDTNAQGSAIFRLPFGDLSLDGSYAVKRNDWHVGLTFAFSLLFDPLSRRVGMTRIGAGSGGNLALKAFVDRNGNDRFDAGEQPVPGVGIEGGFNRAVTNARGEAIVTGLGYTAPVRVQANVDEIDLPSVSTPPTTIEFMPRAGRTTTVMYPLKPEGEVLVRLQLRQAGKLVGLSAVRVRAVPNVGAAIERSTEYDGSVVFDKLKAGTYRLELDADQARRLGMRMTAPISFTVPPDGGVVPDVRGELVFDRAAP